MMIKYGNVLWPESTRMMVHYTLGHCLHAESIPCDTHKPAYVCISVGVEIHISTLTEGKLNINNDMFVDGKLF